MPITKVLFLVDIIVALVAIAGVIAYYVLVGSKKKDAKAADAKKAS